ncbi:B12 binding domain protein [Candidatus Methanoperedenaceae archaeon GB37]|nr:B12 binding domain protein [Candidatus Methanoperedenaceae archaeon GB37]
MDKCGGGIKTYLSISHLISDITSKRECGVLNLKVLLTSPGESFKMQTSYLPLGLGYIAGYLRERGVEVEGLDLRFLSNWDETRERIAGSGADLVCIGAMTIEMPRALAVARIAREELGAKVALGGPHPTVCPDEVIREENVDFVVVGEGEYTTGELVEALEGRRGLHTIKGLLYKEGETIFYNGGREPIADLDTLPYPAREIFPIKEVLSNPVTNFPLPSPALHIFTSRGCPFKCRFCQPCLDMIFGERVRYRSLDNVFSEIEYLIDRYHLRAIMIEDDTFTVNRRRVERFCEEMRRRGLDREIVWYCHSRADTIDREMIRNLKRAGCISICIGIESGSERVLQILGKNVSEEESWNAIRMCKEEGVLVVANIMIGTPGERVEDLEKTVRLIESTEPELVFVGITTPTPGTYLYEDAERSGLIEAHRWTDFDRGKTGGKLKIDLDQNMLKYVRARLSRYGFSERFLTEPHYYEACIKRWRSLSEIGRPEEMMREIKS